MIDLLPWWAWGLLAAPLAFIAWHYLGNKAGLASIAAIAIGMFGASQRRAGRDLERGKRKDATLDAYNDRQRIEDDIQQDDDLVARAKRAGLVRRP